MKLTAVLLFMSCLPLQVLGSWRAGPFQAVFFWYAYRLDAALKPEGQQHTTLAPGLKGTGENGVVLFDDFVKYICEGSNKPTWTTNVGTNLDPEVDDAARELQKVNYDKMDISKLFATDTFPSGHQIVFSDVFSKAVDVIEACHKRVSTGNFQKQFGLAASAMKNVYEARKADQSVGMNRDLRYFLDNKKPWVKVITKREEFFGQSYWAVDTEATVRDAEKKGARKYIRNNIAYFATNYNTQRQLSEDGNAVSHWNLIQSCSEFSDRLHRLC